MILGIVKRQDSRLGRNTLKTMGWVTSAITVAWVMVASAAAQNTAKAPPAPSAVDSSTDNSHRWVAVIFGTIPITREEFGEYLIARNPETVQLLVNKRIIEHACQVRGIEVTNAEVEAELAADLRGLKTDLKTFESTVLRQHKKTLFEWREDVIKSKLLLTKLCKDQVQVSDKDYEEAFEAYYGEKIDCRIILFPKEEERKVMQLYADLRKSDDDFCKQARQQASPTLALNGGKITPISHHTTGNEELEKEAFSLQPGELSRVIQTPEGLLVMKCDRRIPPDTTKKLENEKDKLKPEIVEKKLQKEMQKIFLQLKEEAQAKVFLKKYTSEDELQREVKKELHTELGPSAGPGRSPGGN